jgi:YHS domain-containing protein
MAGFEPEKDVMVTDPVCGMRLTPEKSVAQEEREGWAYFFCSESCHKLFLIAPEQYSSTLAHFSPPSADTDT